MDPKVSILIPAYNAEGSLAESIESALGQTWRTKEVVVVDDGSTDHTLDVARRYEASNFRVISQPNQGGCVARNNAYAACEGDYIQWLDADDLLAPDKIEKQMKVAREVDSARTLLSSAWGTFYFRTSKLNLVPTDLWCDLTPHEWLTRKLEQQLFQQTGAWLVSRQLTEAAGPWDVRLKKDQDGEYGDRLVIHSDGVKFVEDAIAYHRRSGPGSVSYMGQSNEKLDSQFLAIKLSIDYLRGLQEDDRFRKASVSYLQSWLLTFSPERPDIAKEMQDLARQYGGELVPAHLPGKYALIERVAGLAKTKEFQRRYNRQKGALSSRLDKILSMIESR